MTCFTLLAPFDIFFALGLARDDDRSGETKQNETRESMELELGNGFDVGKTWLEFRLLAVGFRGYGVANSLFCMYVSLHGLEGRDGWKIGML